MSHRLVFAGSIVLFLALAGAAVWTAGTRDAWARQLTSANPVDVESARKVMLNGSAESLGILRGLLARSRRVGWQGAAIQLRVLEILAELGPAAQETVPEVVALIDSRDPHVRTLAIQALPAIGTPGEITAPVLLRALGQSPDVPTLRALAEYGPEAEVASPQLIPLLARKQIEAEVRWNAARTLGKTRAASESAIEALVARLSDSDATVREHAAEALGDLGPAAGAAGRHVHPVTAEEKIHATRCVRGRGTGHGIDDNRRLLTLELIHRADARSRRMGMRRSQNRGLVLTRQLQSVFPVPIIWVVAESSNQLETSRTLTHPRDSR